MNAADPRVKRTRKLLQDAFLALLAEKSFHAISVQDIAERATLNRATFYAHFVDKHALLDQVIRDAFREALSQSISADAPFTVSNLHLLVVTVLEFLASFHGRCTPADHDLKPVFEATVQEELYTFLTGWLGQLPPGAPADRAKRETAALVMSWAIFGVGIEWSRGTRGSSANERASQLLAVIVDGIAETLGLAPAPQRTHEHRAVREVVSRR